MPEGGFCDTGRAGKFIMSNVVRFAHHAAQSRGASGQGGLAPLLACFAHHRRHLGDAFWLKENAEVLNILVATGRRLPELALAVYQPFYEGIEAQIGFYPQYYRMLLSVTQSLEALGYPGRKSEALAAWIVAQGWPEIEVNDLQRAETRYLLGRAGQTAADDGLDDRLIRFMSRPATFAVPNPRAAYDMLHAIFYLSHYGRRPLDLPAAALTSLQMCGALAHLDQDGDLLAEVCLALRYCGQPLPPLWLDLLRHEARSFKIDVASCSDSADAYHNFLVNQWLLETIGDTAFGDIFYAGPMRFILPRPLISPLREWSQALLALGSDRRADWAAMRSACAPRLSAAAVAVADAGAEGSPGFEAFFAHFARSAQPFAGPTKLVRIGA